MMISPEIFYEMELKGKSADEIESRIRGQKNEIGRLKSLIESQEINQEPFACPLPSTRLACNRLYLARAKQALFDAGGKYKLSQKEKRIQSFDESIPFIEQICLSYGGHFYGYEYRTITFSEETVILDVGYVLQESEDKKPFVRKFPGMKRDFLEAFAALHIGEWKATYNNCSVMDGTKRKLTIRFSNGHREVKKEGSNAYPYNFNDFYELMKLEENDEFSGEQKTSIRSQFSRMILIVDLKYYQRSLLT